MPDAARRRRRWRGGGGNGWHLRHDHSLLAVVAANLFRAAAGKGHRDSCERTFVSSSAFDCLCTRLLLSMSRCVSPVPLAAPSPSTAACLPLAIAAAPSVALQAGCAGSQDDGQAQSTAALQQR